jgi:glycine/D-amino acid oxidase-like deaminating enzyme
MRRLRRVVEIMLPEFNEREFVKSYCCWCTGASLLRAQMAAVDFRLLTTVSYYLPVLTTDTDDAEWLFCEHPTCPGLYLATGDSGHSFTSLPVVGGQVADLLEGKVSVGTRFESTLTIANSSAFQLCRCPSNAWGDSVGGPVEVILSVPVEEVL